MRYQWIIGTLALLVGSVGLTSNAAAQRFASGSPYPDFALPNIDDGKPIRLSDYRGKKVLLIHFASW